MQLLHANIKNELQKLFLKKKTIAFFIIAAIIPIVSIILVLAFRNGLGIISANTTSFPLFVLGIFTNVFLPLFAAMVAIDLFSGEVGDKNLKITLLRPISRFKIYTSKILSVGIYICINLGLVFVISVILGFFLSGKDALLPGLLKDVLAYLVAVVPMLSIVIAVAFISQFFKSSSGALTVCILVFICAKVVPIFSQPVSRILITSYTDWHLMWIGSFLSYAKIFNVFMLFLSYSLIFFAAGFYIFDKKEL